MKHTLATLTVGTVLAIAPGPSNADTPEEPADPIALAQLDGFALGLARAEKFSGVLLVAKDGEVVLERAYGKRDAHSEDGNTVDTRFNLASAGKMFTAVAVLQQVAAGRLTLDTPVGEVLADYPNRDFAAQVTVRHLLTHAAGAGDIDLFGVENAANRADVDSVAEMVALHAGRAPSFAPGSNTCACRYASNDSPESTSTMRPRTTWPKFPYSWFEPGAKAGARPACSAIISATEWTAARFAAFSTPNRSMSPAPAAWVSRWRTVTCAAKSRFG